MDVKQHFNEQTGLEWASKGPSSLSGDCCGLDLGAVTVGRAHNTKPTSDSTDGSCAVGQEEDHATQDGPVAEQQAAVHREGLSTNGLLLE